MSHQVYRYCIASASLVLLFLACFAVRVVENQAIDDHSSLNSLSDVLFSDFNQVNARNFHHEQPKRGDYVYIDYTGADENHEETTGGSNNSDERHAIRPSMKDELAKLRKLKTAKHNQNSLKKLRNRKELWDVLYGRRK
jgi:hypothetical protein